MANGWANPSNPSASSEHWRLENFGGLVKDVDARGLLAAGAEPPKASAAGVVGRPVTSRKGTEMGKEENMFKRKKKQ